MIFGNCKRLLRKRPKTIDVIHPPGRLLQNAKNPSKCHSESASAGEESLDFIDVTAFKRSFADAQDDKITSWITCSEIASWAGEE